MTERELRKLKREDLLQMIFYLKKKNEELSDELEKLRDEKNSVQNSLSDFDILRIAAAVREELQRDEI